MKKIILIIFIVLIFTPLVSAQTWFTADSLSVDWTAPTTLIDGSPIPVGDIIKYNLYIKDAINPQAIEELIVSNLMVQTYLVKFTKEGRFFIGVCAVRYIGGITYIGESIIAWSSDPVYTLNNPFGGVYYISPSPPTGLRKQ